MQNNILNTDWQEHWFNDIEFFLRIKNSSTVSVDFQVFETGVYDDGNGSAHKFIYFNDGGGIDFTTDISKAEPYVTGFIKWDGCSEVDFMRNIHSCGGRMGLVRLGKLFEEIFSVSSSMIDCSGDYL